MRRSTQINRCKGVAYIAGQLKIGGSEQQLYRLLQNLDRSRFVPIVIHLGESTNEYWNEPISRLSVPVYHVSHFAGVAVRIYRIARILRSAKIELVHGWVLHANPYAAFAGRLAGVPVRVGSMRGSYDRVPEKRLVRWTAYRGLDALITNSDVAAQAIAKSRAKLVTRFVPNGIFLSAEPSLDCRGRLKAELGIGGDTLLIGTVGRADSNKNHSMLLRVFSKLIDKWQKLRMVIIGGGPILSSLRAEAKVLGIGEKVFFSGEIPCASRYLPAFDICCLTSYQEGSPNLIMEASAASVPVVSTVCGGTVDLIEHGLTGYVVCPDDDDAMAAYVDVLLASPAQRNRMGKNGRRKMQREFSVEGMVSAMTEVYEELLALKGVE